MAFYKKDCLFAELCKGEVTNIEVINLLLAYPAFPINGNEQNKDSPLQFAAKYKNRASPC